MRARVKLLSRFIAIAQQPLTRAWHNGIMTATETNNRVWGPGGRGSGRAIEPARPKIVVAIVDPTGDTNHLERLLPRRWTTRRFNNVYEIHQPELLVLGGASPPLVAAARLLHPDATLFALIHEEAPPSAIGDILHSGADVCVRDGAMDILATHLIAGHRRKPSLGAFAGRF